MNDNVINLIASPGDHLWEDLEAHREELESADGYAIMWYKTNNGDVKVSVKPSYTHLPDFVYSVNMLLKMILEDEE